MGENKPADPQAPVIRKGFLISIKTGDPTEIKERDVVSEYHLETRLYFNLNLNNNHKQYGRCRAVTEFEKLNRIGEGTYGIVCKLK